MHCNKAVVISQKKILFINDILTYAIDNLLKDLMTV